MGKIRFTSFVQDINSDITAKARTKLENAEAVAKYLITPGITVKGPLNNLPAPINKGSYVAGETHVSAVAVYTTGPATPLRATADIEYTKIVNDTPGVDQFDRIHVVGSSTFVESFKSSSLTDLVNAITNMITNVPLNAIASALGAAGAGFEGTALWLTIGNDSVDKTALLDSLDLIPTPWSSLTSEQQSGWTLAGLSESDWTARYSTGKALIINSICQGEADRLYHVHMAPVAP